MSEEHKECSICLESLNTSISTKTKCNHDFHESCIDNWLDIQNKCPICRCENPISHKKYDYNKLSINVNIGISVSAEFLEAVLEIYEIERQLRERRQISIIDRFVNYVTSFFN